MNMGIPNARLFGMPLRTGIFNIADLAIMGGLFLLVFFEFFGAREHPEADSQSNSDTPA